MERKFMALNMGELHDPPLSFIFPAVNLWHMIWDYCSHLPTLTCEKIWVCKSFWRRGMWSVCTAPVSERLIIGGWCCINIWEFRLPWWLDTIPDLSGSFSLWLTGHRTKLRLGHYRVNLWSNQDDIRWPDLTPKRWFWLLNQESDQMDFEPCQTGQIITPALTGGMEDLSQPLSTWILSSFCALVSHRGKTA